MDPTETSHNVNTCSIETTHCLDIRKLCKLELRWPIKMQRFCDLVTRGDASLTARFRSPFKLKSHRNHGSISLTLQCYCYFASRSYDENIGRYNMLSTNREENSSHDFPCLFQRSCTNCMYILSPSSNPPLDESSKIDDETPPSSPMVANNMESAIEGPSIVDIQATLPITYHIIEGSTKRQREQLIDSQGFRYTVQRRLKESVHWQCFSRPKVSPCKAKIIQRFDGSFVHGKHLHNHARSGGKEIVAKVMMNLRNEAPESIFQPMTGFDMERSPLQTQDQNVISKRLPQPSKLRPPAAVKRPYIKDSMDEPKLKVPKCDLAIGRSSARPSAKPQLPTALRRQTSAAVVRRTVTTKNDMPPPSTARTAGGTLKRQTSANSLKRGTSTNTKSVSKATSAKGSSNGDAKQLPKVPGKGKKRSAWDYKGRLEDMENYLSNTKGLMDNMNNSMNNNRERIEYLESVKKELEGTIEVKHQQGEQASARIQDLQAHILITEEELNSLKLKHDFEIEVKENKIKTLVKEKDALERELKVSESEVMALKTTMAQITAQTSGLNAELEATKINLRSNIELNRCKDERIAQLLKEIQDQRDLIAEKDSKLRDEEKIRRKLHNAVQELKGNIRVFCRIRPALEAEKNAPLANFTLADEDRGIIVEQTIPSEDVAGNKKAATRHEFSFDKIFNHSSQQGDVFQEISQLVQSALDGYNVCIFAYGQTGSGKTFTMEGSRDDHDQRGMIPRSMEQVFETAESLQEKGWKYSMQASFLEIYNETIRDLLGSGDDSIKYDIKIVNNGKSSTEPTEVMVTNLKSFEVTAVTQVSDLLQKATQNRAVAATNCNERSSRSHSVFILKLTGENHLTGEKCQGTLNLIDLAGSERLRQSCSKGERLKETKNINSSLSNLSNVIMALANKESFIPYRNSKLTYLLKNSLGGNSKSLMFVNVSPREESFQETLCSLRFATKVNQCNIGTAQKKVVK